jgi:hypothetical protein
MASSSKKMCTWGTPTNWGWFHKVGHAAGTNHAARWFKDMHPGNWYLLVKIAKRLLLAIIILTFAPLVGPLPLLHLGYERIALSQDMTVLLRKRASAFSRLSK